ncbi:TPA: SIR2 family protein [Pasteurella multocida]|uniref:SIR2 family protein n=1 Tax=Pasteurella multocida TaxID=747 RepID=UPI002948681B|nr:SIR2 family protein [Pasteurella multocida]MEE3747535.1 SIR2 family protein [Pasteurella multocida]HDR1012825.1 SIR2 family protein [Pasteurella multocida]HDR1014346.1 SIR2 family protein [Pasteurella multocida]HDR1016888.1 SIR2 family protein [Pasteurella multocida]
MEFTSKQKKFINDFVVEIKNGDAAIFAGAGLSASVGFVNWKELLKDLAEDLKLDVEKEYDLIGLAQYHCNKFKRGKINNKIINEFTTMKQGSENHKLLSKIGINTFWTTNYDQLIEKTLEADGKTVEKKIRNEDFARNIKKKDAIIYKMHGDKDSPDEAVLIKDDYETYQDKKELFATALRGDLLSKTFLFIGFSFDDPNLEYILGRIKVLLKDNTPTHYCFFKEVAEQDFSDTESYLYTKVKQKLKMEDLVRYGIHSILVKEYSDITNILKEIDKRLKRSNIFISGAAHSYEPFSEDRAKELIHKLSYRLAEKEYKIISGYGLGIGSMVINGALEYKYQSHYRNLDDLLILRPFPQMQSGDKSISERWTDYRNDIISQAGIAIFMFGNKLDKEGQKVLSDGMREEFEICLQHNVIPIPIGCTESISREFWDDVLENHRHLYSDDESLLVKLEEIGKDDITDEIISKVVAIVDKLQKL